MNLSKVVVIILGILLIILIISAFKKKSSTLTTEQDGKIQTIIPNSQLDKSSNTNSNYSYSVWFYIDDWTYKYGQEKVILTMADSVDNYSPKITLGAFQNDLNVSIMTYPDSLNTDASNTSQTFNCAIKNIPIQSWANVLISVNNRVLDLYLDGKLVRTCVMPGIAKIINNAPLIITPQGGFSGSTSHIEYWGYSKNPQEAWNIYKKGNGGSLFGNISNKYRVKLSFLNDNTESASISI